MTDSPNAGVRAENARQLSLAFPQYTWRLYRCRWGWAIRTDRTPVEELDGEPVTLVASFKAGKEA